MTISEMNLKQRSLLFANLAADAYGEEATVREVVKEHGFTEEMFSKQADLSKFDISYGKGCQDCKFTGYLGRTGIYEFLVPGDAVKEQILARQSADRIRRKAVQGGMRTLRQDGLDKVVKGLTTLSEVARVCEIEE